MPDTFSFEDAQAPPPTPPSASVGMPEDAGQFGPGTKYSPGQMAQLNAARDNLRMREARGDSDTYGGEAKANSFSFQDAVGTSPASTNPPSSTQGSFLDELKKPFAGETLTSLYKQNMFANLATYSKNLRELAPDVMDAYNKAKADGSYTGSLIGFAQQNTAQMYQDKYDAPAPHIPTPSVDWLNMPKQMLKAAIANPGRTLGELAHGLATDPELLALPETGVAGAAEKLGVAAGKVARAGEMGVEMGAQSGAIEGAKQLKEGGEITDPNAVAQSAAQGAVAGAGLSIIHSAASLGLAKLARDKGATVTPEVKQQVATEINSQVAAGTDPTDALVNTLTKHGLDRKTANTMADAVEPYIEKTETPDAVQEPGAGAVLQRQPSETPEAGGQRGRVEQGQQGQEAAQAGQAEVAKEALTRPRTYEELANFAYSQNIAVADHADRAIYGGAVDKQSGLTDNTIYTPNADHEFYKSTGASREDIFAHELGHAMLNKWGIGGDIRGPQYEDLRAQLRAASRSVYPNEWADPAFAKHHNSGSELLADGLSVWIQHPELRRSLGALQDLLGTRLGDLDRLHEPDEIPPLQFEKPEVKASTEEPKPAPVGAPTPESKAVEAVSPEWYSTPATSKTNRGPGTYVSKSPLSTDVSVTKLEPEREARLFDETQPVPSEHARSMLEDAGMTDEEAGKVLGRNDAIPGKKLNAALNKFMGGEWRHSNDYLRDHYGHTGIKYADKDGNPQALIFDNVKAQRPDFGQSGKADPKVLASLGLAGIGGLGIYALSGDKTDAIAAAAALGLLPFARAIVGRLGKGVAQVVNQVAKPLADNIKEPENRHFADVNVPRLALDKWAGGARALLKGDPGFDSKGKFNPLQIKPRAALRDAAFVRIRDYVQGHRDVPLTPRELAGAAAITKLMDALGQHGLDEGAIRNLVEDYLPGIYQKKPFQSVSDLKDELAQNGAFRSNYTGMSPKSRFALQKIIPDYRTAERLAAEKKVDVVPLTNDPFKLATIYGKSLTRTIANKRLIDTYMATPSPTTVGGKAVPLIVGHTADSAARKIWQTMAMMGQQFDIPKENTDIAAKFAIMHAPKDYVAIKHPALDGMRVHQDLAPSLKMLFDTSDPSAIAKAAYATSMARKSLLFSYSMFHASALATVGAALTVGRAAGGMGNAMRFSVARQLPRAARMWMGDSFTPEMRDAVENGGLTLGKVQEDVNPEFFQRAMGLAETYARGLPRWTGAPLVADSVKALKFAHQAMNDFVFQKTRPTLELATYMGETGRWMAKNPDATPEQILQAKHDIGSATSKMYGTMNWVDMANNVPSNTMRTIASALFSPNGRRWQQVAMLSPEWNISSIDTWYQGLRSTLPGVTPKASDSLYRTYLLASAATYMGAAYMLQKHYTGENFFEKDDWGSVDRGDGTRLNLNKHFMETYHLLSNPQKFVLGKLGYLPAEALDQLFGKEYTTYIPNANGRDAYTGPKMKDTSALGRVEHAAKSFFTPITINNFLNDPEQAVYSFFGIPLTGTSYAKQEEHARETARAQGKDEEAAVDRVKAREQRAIANRKE